MDCKTAWTEVAKDLTRAEYELFRRLIYEKSGINLGDQKMQLVRARLGKQMRSGRYKSYRAYFEFVQSDPTGNELCRLIDAISTNTTHLFREKQHFDFLAKTIRGWAEDTHWRNGRRHVRIWSAACSSGEEAHSIAMTAHHQLANCLTLTPKILATDISTRVLARARAGLYEPHRLGTVPIEFRLRYLVAVHDQEGKPFMQISPDLQRLITFARLNLMSDTFPFHHPFDFIFCRNVMIYFDRPTQQTLVNKLARHLRPGGYLLIGHSESLNGLNQPLRYVRPTVYQKPIQT